MVWKSLIPDITVAHLPHIACCTVFAALRCFLEIYTVDGSRSVVFSLALKSKMYFLCFHFGSLQHSMHASWSLNRLVCGTYLPIVKQESIGPCCINKEPAWKHVIHMSWEWFLFRRQVQLHLKSGTYRVRFLQCAPWRLLRRVFCCRLPGFFPAVRWLDSQNQISTSKH